MPRFSIIIPVYNVGKYISQCLDSICSQTFNDFEAIVVDDGSPDNAPQICDAYAQKDSRIRVFHKSNGGVSTALNLGLENAFGEWIYFVDGDDWIEENALEIMGKYIDNHPDIDILGFNHIRNYSNRIVKCPSITEKIYSGEEIKLLAVSTIDPKFIEKKYSINLPAIRGRWSKVFKRDKIRQVRFKNDLIIGEDGLFCMEAFFNSQTVLLVNEHLYHYRINEESVIHKYRENFDYLGRKTKYFLENQTLKGCKYWRECFNVFIFTSFKSILMRYLLHKENTLKFFQKRILLRNFFQENLFNQVFLSLDFVRVLPYYVPFLALIKLKCCCSLLVLGKFLKGR